MLMRKIQLICHCHGGMKEGYQKQFDSLVLRADGSCFVNPSRAQRTTPYYPLSQSHQSSSFTDCTAAEFSTIGN
jgi:hypothetical protein